MTACEPRFEVVQSDAGWFARFVGANGRKVWQTESYVRRAAAVRAVELICDDEVTSSPFAEHPEIRLGPWRTTTEVRTVDERSGR